MAKPQLAIERAAIVLVVASYCLAGRLGSCLALRSPELKLASLAWFVLAALFRPDIALVAVTTSGTSI